MLTTTTQDLVEKWGTKVTATLPKTARDRIWGRGVRMSEMGGCNRKQTLRLAGYRAEYPSVFDKERFEKGLLWEEIIAAVWESEYPGKVQRGVEVVTPYGTGEIDLWIPHLPHLVECKTTKPGNESYLPMTENVIQLQMYLHFFGAPKGVKEAELCYALKNEDDLYTSRVRSFSIDYDPELAVMLVDEAKNIHRHGLLKKILPIPVAYSKDRFPCAWRVGQPDAGACAFYRRCWGENPVEPTGRTEESRA
jgi:hypothetical protein